jgi:hypothetical protein
LLVKGVRVKVCLQVDLLLGLEAGQLYTMGEGTTA